MSEEEATFYLPPASPDERWTSAGGQEFIGRGVRYGRLGQVGVVARVLAVDAGRALRLHVALSRSIRNPDRRKFSLVPQRASAPKNDET